MLIAVATMALSAINDIAPNWRGWGWGSADDSRLRYEEGAGPRCHACRDHHLGHLCKRSRREEKLTQWPIILLAPALMVPPAPDFVPTPGTTQVAPLVFLPLWMDLGLHALPAISLIIGRLLGVRLIQTSSSWSASIARRRRPVRPRSSLPLWVRATACGSSTVPASTASSRTRSSL